MSTQATQMGCTPRPTTPSAPTSLQKPARPANAVREFFAGLARRGAPKSRQEFTGVIRKMRTHEVHSYEDHLLRLDLTSRNQRFMGGVSDHFISLYAKRCLADGAIVFAYLENGKILGVAELHIDASAKDTAEVAFSVEPPLRRRGIGQRLFHRLIVSARNIGIRHLRLNCHADNEAMLCLARKFRAQITYAQGEAFGLLDLPPATPVSAASEVIHDIGEPVRERRPRRPLATALTMPR